MHQQAFGNNTDDCCKCELECSRQTEPRPNGALRGKFHALDIQLVHGRADVFMNGMLSGFKGQLAHRHKRQQGSCLDGSGADWLQRDLEVLHCPCHKESLAASHLYL